MQEIERLQQEKKETPTQLKAVLEQIQQEMKSLPIQQKLALQIYYNRFEDAQRRALAYLDYLSRLKTQLQEKEKRLKSDLGEIKKLKQKVKKNNENIASNQEWLERHREWRDESQSNNPTIQTMQIRCKNEWIAIRTISEKPKILSLKPKIG
ncbi:hypothetical protein [Helicobacter pylori]|uniref:hypothetical protein n=1 Tax=Helicobacter pylori TaxID=210 RepID=UPI00217D97F1|nr:hypothetical protein [Helicobacter pylori]